MSWTERYGVHSLDLQVSTHIQVTWQNNAYRVSIGPFRLNQGFRDVASAKQAGLEYVRDQLVQALCQVSGLLGPAEEA